MKNYWLDRKASKSEVCTWDFQTELAKTIKEKYESQYVKVVEVTNVSLREVASARRWQRMELQSLSGHSWDFNDEEAPCGDWKKGWDTPFDFGESSESKPLEFKRKYRWDFSDVAEKPSDEVVLPPWNTETYNGIDLNEKGWECDL